MAFIAHNFSSGSDEAAITVDKFGRLYLNAQMRKKLGIVEGAPFKCHVGFDVGNGNIGLARPGEVSVGDEISPASFDGKRYYASVRSFIKKNDVKLGKYVYIERANNWYAFRRADDVNPDATPQQVVPSKPRKKKEA